MTYVLVLAMTNALLVFVLLAPWEAPMPTFGQTEELLRHDVAPDKAQKRWSGRLLRALGVVLNQDSKLARDLVLAESPLTLFDVYVYKGLCLVAGLALAALVFAADEATYGIIVGMGGLIAFGLPEARIKGQAKRIRAEIDRRLPAFLQALAMMMEAGMNLYPAMEAYLDQDSSALGCQLAKAVHEVRLGAPLSEALMRMAARCGVDDLYRAVASLVQASERGAAGLTITCRDLSSEAWAKRRDRARELGQHVSTKMFLPLLALILPTILLFLMGPAVWDMIHNL